MSKITIELRDAYQQHVKYYKTRIEDIEKNIKKLKVEIAKDASKKELSTIEIVNMMLNQITVYCGMNELSIDVLEVKNTGFLDKARRLLYEVLISLSSIVADYVDAPFSEYSENLVPIAGISDSDRLALVKKIGFCIALVEKKFW